MGFKIDRYKVDEARELFFLLFFLWLFYFSLNSWITLDGWKILSVLLIAFFFPSFFIIYSYLEDWFLCKGTIFNGQGFLRYRKKVDRNIPDNTIPEKILKVYYLLIDGLLTRVLVLGLFIGLVGISLGHVYLINENLRIPNFEVYCVYIVFGILFGMRYLSQLESERYDIDTLKTNVGFFVYTLFLVSTALTLLTVKPTKNYFVTDFFHRIGYIILTWVSLEFVIYKLYDYQSTNRFLNSKKMNDLKDKIFKI